MKNSQNDQDIVLPENKEIRNLWPKIYEDIMSEIKDPSGLPPFPPLETRVRTILKKHLGTELIRTDAEYQKFFKDAIRFAVLKDTDKMMYRIEGGRARYGENRHSKGRIPPTSSL